MTELDLLPEDWEVVRLGVIAEKFIGGGTPSTSNEEYWNGEIHWTTSKKINGIHLLNGEKKITKRGLEESSTHLIPKDNLVIGTRVGVGKIAINKVDIAISQDLTGAFIDKEKYALEFLAYQICTKEIQNIFKGRARGTTIKGIPRDDLKKIPLKIPPLPEQHRIAAVLSAVQDAKEKTGAVIAAAKSLKKSLMRHLFTYGPVPAGAAESVVLAETEIGLVPEGWIIINVGEVGKVVTGTTPRTSVPEYYGGAYMFTSPGDIGEEMYVKKAEKYISEKGLKVSRPLPRDTVLVVCIGATIGKTALTSAEQSTTNQQINAIIPNEKVFAHYLYYAISHRAPYLPSLAGRAAVPIVNKSNFTNFPIPLPPLTIQQKIASILSTVDKKIESEENKKKALDELFKSLLRNLMTGKIRVNHMEMPQ